MELLSHLTVCCSNVWSDSEIGRKSENDELYTKDTRAMKNRQRNWKIWEPRIERIRKIIHCISPFADKIECFDLTDVSVSNLTGTICVSNPVCYRYSIHFIYTFVTWEHIEWCVCVVYLFFFAKSTVNTQLKLYLIQWKIYNNINIQQQVPFIHFGVTQR